MQQYKRHTKKYISRKNEKKRHRLWAGKWVRRSSVRPFKQMIQKSIHSSDIFRCVIQLLSTFYMHITHFTLGLGRGAGSGHSGAPAVGYAQPQCGSITPSAIAISRPHLFFQPDPFYTRFGSAMATPTHCNPLAPSHISYTLYTVSAIFLPADFFFMWVDKQLGFVTFTFLRPEFRFGKQLSALLHYYGHCVLGQG